MPVASIEIQARSHGLSAQLREARAKFGTFADGVAGLFFDKLDKKKKGFFAKGGFLSGMGTVTAGQLGASAFSRAATFLEEIGQSSVEFGDKLTRLRIQAGSTPAVMDDFSKSIRKASDLTGLSKAAILEGANAYVTLTGDMATAISSTETWARIAQATNSTVTDIATSAAAMSQNMKIGPQDMEAVFSTLATQGKLGAIEMKDLAGTLSQITPQWAMFAKGTGVQGVRELGAALQVVKRGFGGDAAETVTGLQSLLTALVKNAGKFREAGVKGLFTVDKNGAKHMVDVYTMVQKIGESKLMKDPTALEKAFGRVEAYRAFLQMKDNREEMLKMVEASKDETVIARDLDTYLASTAGKTKQAWETAKNSVAEAFTPERIEAFAKIAVALAKSLGFAAEQLGNVLKGAETVGRGLASMFGGESEEDRIKKIKKHRYDERVAHHMRLGESEDQAKATIGREDALRDAIAGGTRMGGGTRAAEYVDEQMMIGKGKNREAITHLVKKRLGAGDSAYDVDELQKMKRDLPMSSDSAMLAQVIDQAIEKRVNKGMDAVADKLAALLHGQPINVKVGADTVANATKTAPANRRGVSRQ